MAFDVSIPGELVVIVLVVLFASDLLRDQGRRGRVRYNPPPISAPPRVAPPPPPRGAR